ncbi:hypothetical protein [Sphingomonas sp. PAMC 26605]|uniref:hypothetical protein n=1 Tax=Sphingomonas sp. PAMC 26605 TaxID=1112214 RepID=UPI0012F515FC|nr:hypothetical protein [Sphingomonas sp. PAMC 26605]
MEHIYADQRLIVWIGEIADPYRGTIDRLEKYSALEGADATKIVIDWNFNPARISMVRAADGSTPMHIACENGNFRATWDFEEIALWQQAPQPDIEACVLYLEHGPSLTRNQVLKGVFNLWPGETVNSDGYRISFTEQQLRGVPAESYLSQGSTATNEFLHVIGESIAGSLNRSKGVLLELSGGMDSSCSVLAAALLRDDLSSYGLVHEGAVGIQQSSRRRELVELLSLNDHEYPSNVVSPIAALKYEECLFTPMDDNHRLACVHAISSHPDVDRLDMVITGIGGDELGMERTYIRRDYEVSGLLSSSAVLASVGRGDIFLRRGIWPCNPLATHRVVNFCRRLPRTFRNGRLLHVLTLARSGLSDSFIFPRYGENFGPLLIREAALTDFDAEVGESILADYGINIFELLRDAREQAGRDFTTDMAVRLWHLLKLERILKKYVGSQKVSEIP